MRTYELRGDGIEALTAVERPVPRPGPGQVLVRMRAASLNYRDLLIADGTYARGAAKDRLVPLSDGAGEVVELGTGTTRLALKDRVVGAFFQKWLDGPFDLNQAVASALGGSIDGVLSEYVVLDEAGAIAIPDGLSFEEAATLPCAAVTAWVGLVELGQVRPAETVLVLGTGGVSLFALQFAKDAGASVILISSSDEKLARGTALGADHTINYRECPEWDERARELTLGRGVDHILEVGGQGTLSQSLRALREGGHVALVGQLSGAMAEPAVARESGRHLRVDSVFVGSARQLERVSQAVERSRRRPQVDRVFAFEDAKRAYRYLESGAHFGKIVIRI